MPYKLNISFPAHNWAKAVADLNVNFLHIRIWCFENRPLPNPDKTKRTVYLTRQRLQNLPGIRRKRTDAGARHVVKNLGVTFDSSLTFHQHIVQTVSSCFSRLAQINRVKHVFDRST